MKAFISYIRNLLKPHRKIMLILMAAAIGAALCEAVAPLLMGKAFDAAIAKSPWAIWSALLLGWFAIRYGSQVLRTFVAKRGEHIGQSIAKEELLSNIEKLLHKPIPFHHDSKSHEISETLSRLRWETISLARGAIFDLIPALISCIAILLYVATLDWRITLELILTLALFTAYIISVSKQWSQNWTEWFEIDEQTSSPGLDALKNILVIKSSTNESTIQKKLREGLDSFYKVDRKFNELDLKSQNIQNAIVSLGVAGAFVLAASNLAHGTFTLGTVFAISSYTFSVLGYVTYAQWTYRAFREGAGHYDRAQKLLSIPSEDYTSGRNVELKGSVAFNHISFRYLEEKAVLENVTFEVHPGQKIALVGESGEGKTTIIELLGRYYLPKSGTITFDGIESKEINLLSLRSQMAYVPQDLSLLHESIEENIRFGKPGSSNEEVRDAAKKAQLFDFIESLPEKWATKVGERGLKLSGGQRQRVALARAFLRNPTILILDEPTSNLDSKTEALIQQSLTELMKGKTTFIIAHRLRTVLEADQILVLKDGIIAESGTHTELMNKKGAYFRLRELQENII